MGGRAIECVRHRAADKKAKQFAKTIMSFSVAHKCSRCSFMRFGIRFGCMKATHMSSLLILISLGSFSWHWLRGVRRTHAQNLALTFFFFFGITARRKRNASLKQKINTNTFPGQTGTTRAPCNLLSRTLTWKHNLPVTVDDVVKRFASLLQRISQLLQKPYQAHLSHVRYVGGCFRLYLVFTTWSHSPYKPLPNEFERHLLFWHLIDAAWCENKALHRSYRKTCRPI